MKRILCRKLLCGLLALMLLLSLISAAMAEATRLRVEFYGLYPAADGAYQKEAVYGTFEVYQNELLVGTLQVTPDGENTIALETAADVRLAPVPGSYPEELELNAYGYGLSLTAGCLNVAPVSVYARAAASATAAPTEQPSPIPEATATSEPTPLPTAAPTTIPAPASGVLVVTASGEVEDGASYVITAGEELVAEGVISDAKPIRLEELSPGEYLITLTLKDNVVLTSLNSNACNERGTAQWQAVVASEQESLYNVELTATGDLLVPFENVTDAKVMVSGERESFEVIANAEGVYERKNLLPDTYQVEMQLPAGRYEYDDPHHNWSMTENADGTCTLSMRFGIERDCVTELPLISRNIIGTVSGRVVDLEGDALSGVEVALYSGSEVVAKARTDKNGEWQIETLTYGEYTAQYNHDKYAIPADSFTLSDDNVDTSLSAAAEPPAKITVRAFLDDNNNGIYGRGDSAFKGLEVSLVDESGAVVATGVTAKDGYVTLAAPEGKYKLRASTPEDYGFGQKGSQLSDTHSVMNETVARTQESDYITLAADKKAEAGISVLALATVSGTVWKDVNADGIWQEDEPGIPGIRLTLKGGRDRLLLETVTDENGYYEFRQVQKGSHELLCYVPDEMVFTVKADGAVEKISRMTTEKDRAGSDRLNLERGEVHDQHNIGLMDGVIIEGVCFLDNNYNGIYDEGEQLLPGVELRLARQSNNVKLQSVVSGEDGTYRFVGQRGSTFTIRALLPKGYIFTQLGEGENANRFAPNGESGERRLMDLTVENGGCERVLLGAVNFGSINGQVYFDSNFSSAWESGERTGDGNYITLLDAEGNKIITHKADKRGYFTFEDLTPGVYYLSMKPENGYAFTALGENNVMQTQPDGSGLSRPIQLAMGEDMINAGIGMIVPAVVNATVFADDNDNGLLDGNEAGLAGTIVRLMDEDGEVSSVTVGEQSSVCFNAVLPGRYYLQYELPAFGVFAVQAESGSAITGENGAARTEWFSVNSGDSWTAPLCGAVVLSHISGYAYADNDGSSVMDGDEPYVSGMVITLKPTRGDLPEMTVTTGADGAFEFSDLRPDTYTLSVICPDAHVLSRLSGVEMPVEIGKASQEVTFRLEMSTQWLDQMLGCVIPSSWTGEAWLDENWDGVRAVDEAPASGETVQLRDALTGEVVFSVLTDENGVFTIEGIAPGEYELVYPMDEGNLMPKGTCDNFTEMGDVRTNGRSTIRANEHKSGTTLCVVRTTEIGGMVWLEEFNGVTPVQGAVLHLLDASGNAIAEFTTGEDGMYLFKGLMPADYAVDVTIPEGYVLVDASDTKMAEKGLYSFVEEADGLFGKSAVIELRMAKHRLDLDAGMVLPGRLGDKAWLDLNGNGLQDGEEGGIPGITVEVLRGDKVVATAVTDQYGFYVIKGLYPTEYTLRATWPAEIVPTVLREDIKQISSILKEDGTTLPVTVESNKANYAADLGFMLIEEGKLPAGYGEGETQKWKK